LAACSSTPSRPAARPAGGVDELLDDRGELLGGQRARRLERVHALPGEHLAGRGDRGRRDRRRADHLRVRDPSGVHDLGEDDAALGVHGVGDGPPALDLLVRVQARRARVALAHRRGLGALGDDETGPGPLGVVRRHGGVGTPSAVARLRVIGAMTMRLASWSRPQAVAREDVGHEVPHDQSEVGPSHKPVERSRIPVGGPS
jgi:hypothetical protein